MSEPNQYDPTKVMALAQQLVGLLGPLPSETRRRDLDANCMILADEQISQYKAQTPAEDSTHTNLADFFSRDEGLNPSDLAQLCAAFHFSHYCMIPFSVENLRSIARDAGVVLPDRLDMTLGRAKER